MYRYRWNKTQKTSIVQFFFCNPLHTHLYTACSGVSELQNPRGTRYENRMKDAEMGEDEKWEIAVGG